MRHPLVYGTGNYDRMIRTVCTTKAICPTCGKQFSYTSSWVYKKKKTGAKTKYYCRWSCFRKGTEKKIITQGKKKNSGCRWRRALDWAKIKKDRADGMTLKAISEKHSCSANAVRYICTHE